MLKIFIQKKKKMLKINFLLLQHSLSVPMTPPYLSLLIITLVSKKTMGVKHQPKWVIQASHCIQNFMTSHQKINKIEQQQITHHLPCKQACGTWLSASISCVGDGIGFACQIILLVRKKFVDRHHFNLGARCHSFKIPCLCKPTLIPTLWVYH